MAQLLEAAVEPAPADEWLVLSDGGTGAWLDTGSLTLTSQGLAAGARETHYVGTVYPPSGTSVAFVDVFAVVDPTSEELPGGACREAVEQAPRLMAEALEALYPGVKFGIGPPIEQGFYYDVDLGDRKLSSEELAGIEDKMYELAKRLHYLQYKIFQPIFFGLMKVIC